MSDTINDRTERALADIEAAKVEGRVKKTPARMAEFNWGVFQ